MKRIEHAKCSKSELTIVTLLESTVVQHTAPAMSKTNVTSSHISQSSRIRLTLVYQTTCKTDRSIDLYSINRGEIYFIFQEDKS